MVDKMDGLYKIIGWLVVIGMLFAYFFYQVLEFEGDIVANITSFKGIIHMIFVVSINNVVTGLAFDKGYNEGILTEEFETANELNSKVISFYNRNKTIFRDFIRNLNIFEKKIKQEDFLYSKDVVSYEELSDKDKKKYKKLKPLRHNIEGFGAPLIYETNRGGEIRYDSSYKAEKNKKMSMIKKTFTGVLFSLMTINVVVSWRNAKDAIITVAIIGVGLAVNYLVNMYIPYNKLKRVIPKRVLNKHKLMESFTKDKDEVEQYLQVDEKVEQKEKRD